MSELKVLSKFRQFAVERLLQDLDSPILPPALKSLLASPDAYALPHVIFTNRCRFTSNIWIDVLLYRCVIKTSPETKIHRTLVQDEIKYQKENHAVEYFSHSHFIDINVHRSFQNELSIICSFLKTLLDTRHVSVHQRRMVILRDIGEMHSIIGHLALAHLLDSQDALVWMTSASSAKIHQKLTSRCMVVNTSSTWGQCNAQLVRDFLSTQLPCGYDVNAFLQTACEDPKHPDVVNMCIQLQLLQDGNQPTKGLPSWIVFIKETVLHIAEKAKADARRGNARANPIKSFCFHDIRCLVGTLLKNAIPFSMIGRAITEHVAVAYDDQTQWNIATCCAETDALLTQSHKEIFALEYFFMNLIECINAAVSVHCSS